MNEINIKSAFDDVYDTLNEIVMMNEANPKCYEDAQDWTSLIDTCNLVLEFWKKLRREP